MKKIVLLPMLLFSIVVFSQKDRTTKLGKTTVEELKMNSYDKDSTANAVVLYEHANYYIDKKRRYNYTTDYYFRVKILSKEGFDQSKISIQVFDQEKIHSIKAKTYNLLDNGTVVQKVLSKDKIYTKDISEKWRETSFTLPDIKVGSVIEYVYSVTSPYSQIDDWFFQSDIPKMKSDFTASILGNWKYNIKIRGALKLSRNDASVKKNCIYVDGIGQGACSILAYGMDNIPAFQSEEHMLTYKNYISTLSFELKSFANPNGEVKLYTKTWKNADRTLKNEFLDNQAAKKNYFKNSIVPKNIIGIQDDLERAKKAFNLVKDNYTWNEKYWPSRKVRVKKAYKSKTGNIFDINLSLYNVLKASNIDCQLALLATRDKGLLTKLYPVVNEFNYLIVKANINNKIYFLDATDKHLPFGMIQFQALNGEVRIMDFKEGSFWDDIVLKEKTMITRRLSLELTDENLKGELTISRSGYAALNRRKAIGNRDENSILEDFETKHPSFEVIDYKSFHQDDLDKKLIESFQVLIDNIDLEQSEVLINPFLLGNITENPFKLKERSYPIDFGYPRSTTYVLSLKIPKEFKVIELPKPKSVSLPNRGGRFLLSVKQRGNTVDLFFKTSINKKTYSTVEYPYLKEFYNQIIKNQESYIKLKRL
jgi:hypothetical protein